MVLATVPEAPPTIRNQLATSWPAPISAKEPKVDAARFRVRALWWVSSFSVLAIIRLQSHESLRGDLISEHPCFRKALLLQQLIGVTDRNSQVRATEIF